MPTAAASSRSSCSSARSSSSSSARSATSTRCRWRCSPLDPPRPNRPRACRGILRARAGNALIHTIRDIDIATEIDHERFLVLLPYTDHVGASEVARRVIRAVADEHPVVAAGRTFTPRVIGRGRRLQARGSRLSFARLMKDATQALEIARQDGVELAVSRDPRDHAARSGARLAGRALAQPGDAQCGVRRGADRRGDACRSACRPRGSPRRSPGCGRSACSVRASRCRTSSRCSRCATSVTSAARAIGAVNCLQLDGDRLIGHNTDEGGFADGLAAAGFDLRGKRAVLLGAGGAARAVAYGLRGGRAIEVIARRPAEVTWAVAWPWEAEVLRDAFARADLVVDCTSVGLGATDEAAVVDPLPLDALPSHALVSTLVYHRPTRLLERAKARGHATLDGRAMLVHQGARAFSIWTGRQAPLAVMARALDDSLCGT